MRKQAIGILLTLMIVSIAVSLVPSVVSADEIANGTQNVIATLDGDTITYCVDEQPYIIDNSPSEFLIDETMYNAENFDAVQPTSENVVEVQSVAEVIASGTCGENLTWTIDADGVFNISGSGTMTNYSSVRETPWFANRTKATSLVIEDGVTSISDNAFYTCSSLTKAKIGSGVKTIGDKAFYRCTAIAEVHIGASVQSIGSDAFYYCNKLATVYTDKTQSEWESVSIASGNDKLTSATFNYSARGVCGDNLKWEFNAVDTLTISGTGAMYDYDNFDSVPWYDIKSKVKEVIVEYGVTTIGNNTFRSMNCNVSLPDGIVSIGAFAFAVKDINLPDSLVKIGRYAFYGSTFNQITIPDGVEEIGAAAFTYCYNLKEITLPASLKILPNRMLADCWALERVTFSDARELNTVYTSAFNNCTNLKDVYYNGRASWLYWLRANSPEIANATLHISEESISVDCGDNITWNLNEEGTLTISGTGKIDDFSQKFAPWYYMCKDIKKIVIEDGITSVGYCMFRSLDNLTDIIIPSSVNQVDIDAYGKQFLSSAGSEKLKNISVDGDNAFYCSVDGVLFNKDKTELIKYAVGKELVEYVVPDSVLSISPFAFENSILNSVILPQKLTTINRNAFDGCRQLEEIKIPNGVTKIASSTFQSCVNLKRIEIPNSVTNIAALAFNMLSKGVLEVYYGGSWAEWNKININWGKIYVREDGVIVGEAGNDNLLNAKMYYKSTLDMAGTYTVKFDLNDTSGNYFDIKVNAGDFAYSYIRPEREGYIFTGWYANKECVGQPYITGNNVAVRTVNNNLTLYAGWKSAGLIEWGFDTFNFANNPEFCGGKYYISDEYYNILTKDLNWIQRMQMNSYRNNDFGGSCFGMTEVMSLIKLGHLEPWYFDKDARNAHDFDYPINDKKVASLINYYFLSQYLPDVDKALTADKRLGTKKLAQKLVSALNNIDKTGIPVVLNYEFTKNKWTLQWSGHSVLAYKLEDDGTQYKVYIADPNWLVYRDRMSSDTSLKQGVPTYMKISYDYEDISYDSGPEGLVDGSYSTTAGTLRLHSVLTDTSLYDDINIQERLTNQCVYNPSVRTAALDESEVMTELTTNYSSFGISDGVATSNVSVEGVEGDVSISVPEVKMGIKLWSCEIYGEDAYTITPTDEMDEYKTMIVYNNTYECFINTVSSEKPVIYLSPDKGAKITSENKGSKSITVSVVEAGLPWNKLTVTAEVAELVVLPLEDGTVKITSDSSLKNAAVMASFENNSLQVVVSEDTNSILVSCTNVDGKDFLTVEGLTETISQEMTYTVVFNTLGGNIIESLTNVIGESVVEKPESPKREGFIFGGWYIDETFTTEFDFETDVVNGNMNLYAKWEEDPTYYPLVTIVGIDENAQIVLKNGETVNLADYLSLVPDDDYVMLGWTTNDRIMNIEYQTDDVIVVDSDITIYPVYRTKPCTVSQVKKADNAHTVTTTLYGIEQDCYVITAGYKGANLVNLDIQKYSATNEPTVLYGDYDYIKVMVWDGLDTMSQLCEAENIDSDKWEIIQ